MAAVNGYYFRTQHFVMKVSVYIFDKIIYPKQTQIRKKKTATNNYL